MRKAVSGVLGVMLACCVGVAVAAPTPELKANVERNGNVRVKWSFDPTTSRDGTTLEIERSDDGTDFAPLVTIKRARRRHNHLDRVQGAPGPFWYRARVVSDGEATGWSAVARTDGGSSGGGGGSGAGGCPAGSEAEVLRLVNVERAKVGAAPLRDHPLLSIAAAARSTTMARSGHLTHTGWVETIRAAGYRGSFLGENIASGYPSPSSVVGGWMRSDGHRANILRTRFAESGIGCVKDARGRLWWTHDFGG